MLSTGPPPGGTTKPFASIVGNGVLDMEGKSKQPLRPGTVSYVPPGQIHAGRNAGAKEAFKFLLFRIHAKGQPISVELN